MRLLVCYTYDVWERELNGVYTQEIEFPMDVFDSLTDQYITLEDEADLIEWAGDKDNFDFAEIRDFERNYTEVIR